ncbi:hypothetical protein PTSG_10716 [Salpingoeca rosetta]|uniref:EGF-like domain-containing protein n=1 Tax=Salpingoeca rosetta (strain ATCC 50818 / BSB-021) TaxID=946362 RepID=F2UQ65_SALR5|nr:uncharacterized protein PTSG_10716 [Salpingoeca rosetta]EGD79733.1 hypothetical protein PTSG_10716 [Salpingoeca rosetta]|eukprot:XP_004988682.1 hypothetical protein PTSG_10716 [Salpingoeca rosetta]
MAHLRPPSSAVAALALPLLLLLTATAAQEPCPEGGTSVGNDMLMAIAEGKQEPPAGAVVCIDFTNQWGAADDQTLEITLPKAEFVRVHVDATNAEKTNLVVNTPSSMQKIEVFYTNQRRLNRLVFPNVGYTADIDIGLFSNLPSGAGILFPKLDAVGSLKVSAFNGNGVTSRNTIDGAFNTNPEGIVLGSPRCNRQIALCSGHPWPWSCSENPLHIKGITIATTGDAGVIGRLALFRLAALDSVDATAIQNKGMVDIAAVLESDNTFLQDVQYNLESSLVSGRPWSTIRYFRLASDIEAIKTSMDKSLWTIEMLPLDRCAGGVTDPCIGDDVTEPNDSMDTATGLVLNPVSLDFAVDGIMCVGDDDYYVVVLPACKDAAWVKVGVKVDNSGSEWKAVLYSSQGVQLKAITTTNAEGVVDTQLPAVETSVYVMISADASTVVPYSMHFGTGCVDGATAPPPTPPPPTPRVTLVPETLSPVTVPETPPPPVTPSPPPTTTPFAPCVQSHDTFDTAALVNMNGAPAVISEELVLCPGGYAHVRVSNVPRCFSGRFTVTATASAATSWQIEVFDTASTYLGIDGMSFSSDTVEAGRALSSTSQVPTEVVVRVNMHDIDFGVDVGVGVTFKLKVTVECDGTAEVTPTPVCQESSATAHNTFDKAALLRVADNGYASSNTMLLCPGVANFFAVEFLACFAGQVTFTVSTANSQRWQMELFNDAFAFTRDDVVAYSPTLEVRSSFESDTLPTLMYARVAVNSDEYFTYALTVRVECSDILGPGVSTAAKVASTQGTPVVTKGPVVTGGPVRTQGPTTTPPINQRTPDPTPPIGEQTPTTNTTATTTTGMTPTSTNTTSSSSAIVCSSTNDDMYEPNNVITSPYSIPNNVSILRGCANDNDYYRAHVCGGGTITFTLLHEHSSGDLDALLYVYTTTWTDVDISQTSADEEVVTYTSDLAEGEDVFLQVFVPTNGMHVPYELGIERTCLSTDGDDNGVSDDDNAFGNGNSTSDGNSTMTVDCAEAGVSSQRSCDIQCSNVPGCLCVFSTTPTTNCTCADATNTPLFTCMGSSSLVLDDSESSDDDDDSASSMPDCEAEGVISQSTCDAQCTGSSSCECVFAQLDITSGCVCSDSGTSVYMCMHISGDVSGNNTVSDGNDSTPDDNDNTSDGDGDNTPDDNDSTPDDNDNTPDDNDSTPDDNDSTPDDNDNTPDDNDSTPDDNDSTPDDNDNTSDGDNDTTPSCAEDGVTSAELCKAKCNGQLLCGCSHFTYNGVMQFCSCNGPDAFTYTCSGGDSTDDNTSDGSIDDGTGGVIDNDGGVTYEPLACTAEGVTSYFSCSAQCSGHVGCGCSYVGLSSMQSCACSTYSGVVFACADPDDDTPVVDCAEAGVSNAATCDAQCTGHAGCFCAFKENGDASACNCGDFGGNIYFACATSVAVESDDNDTTPDTNDTTPDDNDSTLDDNDNTSDGDGDSTPDDNDNTSDDDEFSVILTIECMADGIYSQSTCETQHCDANDPACVCMFSSSGAYGGCLCIDLTTATPFYACTSYFNTDDDDNNTGGGHDNDDDEIFVVGGGDDDNLAGAPDCYDDGVTTPALCDAQCDLNPFNAPCACRFRTSATAVSCGCVTTTSKPVYLCVTPLGDGAGDDDVADDDDAGKINNDDNQTDDAVVVIDGPDDDDILLGDGGATDDMVNTTPVDPAAAADDDDNGTGASASASSASSLAPIVGAAAGGVLLIACVVGFVVYRRRNHISDSTTKLNSASSSTGVLFVPPRKLSSTKSSSSPMEREYLEPTATTKKQNPLYSEATDASTDENTYEALNYADVVAMTGSGAGNKNKNMGKGKGKVSGGVAADATSPTYDNATPFSAAMLSQISALQAGVAGADVLYDNSTAGDAVVYDNTTGGTEPVYDNSTAGGAVVYDNSTAGGAVVYDNSTAGDAVVYDNSTAGFSAQPLYDNTTGASVGAVYDNTTSAAEAVYDNQLRRSEGGVRGVVYDIGGMAEIHDANDDDEDDVYAEASVFGFGGNKMSLNEVRRVDGGYIETFPASSVDQDSSSTHDDDDDDDDNADGGNGLVYDNMGDDGDVLYAAPMRPKR